MKRPERAVDDCAEDAVFSPSQADGAGVSFNDGNDRLGEMAKLAGFDFYLLSAFPRGDRTAFTENRLISKWPQSLVGFYEAADLFYWGRLVTAMKRDRADLLRGGGVCGQRRQSGTANSTRSFRCKG
ncbi:hypothetical protein [Rhizobium sp.]|uniref:hypothetical protein n=1 Tax=Rhizobium TaxID=379 RepID=UPI0021BC0278